MLVVRLKPSGQHVTNLHSSDLSLITFFDEMSRIKDMPNWKAEGVVTQLFPPS